MEKIADFEKTIESVELGLDESLSRISRLRLIDLKKSHLWDQAHYDFLQDYVEIFTDNLDGNFAWPPFGISDLRRMDIPEANTPAYQAFKQIISAQIEGEILGYLRRSDAKYHQLVLLGDVEKKDSIGSSIAQNVVLGGASLVDVPHGEHDFWMQRGVVHKDYQRQGLGSHLTRLLSTYAFTKKTYDGRERYKLASVVLVPRAHCYEIQDKIRENDILEDYYRILDRDEKDPPSQAELQAVLSELSDPMFLVERTEAIYEALGDLKAYLKPTDHIFLRLGWRFLYTRAQQADTMEGVSPVPSRGYELTRYIWDTIPAKTRLNAVIHNYV